MTAEAKRKREPAPRIDQEHAPGFKTEAQVSSSALAYAPRILLETYARQPQRDPPWIESVEGTLLFADVAGFTQMTERLAEIGKEGAERLTNIINEYFDRMLDIAASYGGGNVKFGGDALLLLFQGDNHAGRAVAAASVMRRANRKFAAVRFGKDRVRLDMCVGVHSGTFWSATAGIPGRRLQHFLMGPEASRVAHAEGLAQAGEILVTANTLEETSGVRAGEPRQATYPVLGVSARTGPPLDRAAEPHLPPLELLTPYLPPPIVRALETRDHASIEGELRKVAIAFIHLQGLNSVLEEEGSTACLEELQNYVLSLVEAAERYGGFLAANDVHTEDLKLIVLFGAPVAHEQDSANALRMALELDRQLRERQSRIGHRVGIDSGYVFAGDVGSDRRREYSVLGDAVNLAARLMSAAGQGEILISRQLAEEAGPGFEVREVAPIRVKGKKDEVAIGVLAGERRLAPLAEGAAEGVLLGREPQLATLALAREEVEAGAGRAVVISGEAGLGKSRLAAEFLEDLRQRGWQVHAGYCYAHTASQPFAPWEQVLSSLFGITPAEAADAKMAKLHDALGHLGPEAAERAELFNALLSVSFPTTAAVSSLDDQTRRRMLFDLIADLIRFSSSSAPVAIVVEDLHWADASSMALLSHLAAGMQSSPVIYCLTHRPQKGLRLDLPEDSTVTLPLGELPQEAAVELIRLELGRADLPQQLSEAILSRAKGNPLFLEEVARSLRQSGALEQVLAAPSFRLAEEMAALDLPDRIQGLILHRLDLLDAGTKEVLRAAAVIGVNFDLPTLGAAIEFRLDEARLASRLRELAEADLAHPEAEQYRFKHALIQEVAYESLLYARRRELHGRVGSFLEATHKDALEPFYEVLVHHFGRSRDHEKTFDYSVKAGDKARQVFAHEEAIQFFRRGLKAVEKSDGAKRVERSYLMERIGDSYEVSGRHKEATEAFSEASENWQGADPAALDGSERILELAGDSPVDSRASTLSRKIAVAYERMSEYDESLRWLDTARRSLPKGRVREDAEILVAKCVALFRKGEYEEAIRWGKRGLELAQKSGDRRQLAYAHDMLASPYMELGKLKEAARHDREAVELYQAIEDLPGQAVANNNLGACYQLLGELDRALNHYEGSLDAHRRVGNVAHAAIVHHNIGEVLLTQGQLDEAATHFQSVVDTYERSGGQLALVGLTLVNLSRASQRLGRQDEAIESVIRGMEVLRESGARGLLTEALLQRAEVELETGRSEAAWRSCQRALREARRRSMELLEARGLRILGRLEQARGRWEKAEADLSESADMAKRIGADYEEGLALLSLAEYYREGGKGREFRAAQKRAAGIFRRLGAEWDLARALEAGSDSSA